jgi:hypothetical protein
MTRSNQRRQYRELPDLELRAELDQKIRAHVRRVRAKYTVRTG